MYFPPVISMTPATPPKASKTASALVNSVAIKSLRNTTILYSQAQTLFDSERGQKRSFSAAMATKETGGKNAPLARRLRGLRKAIWGDNASAFAASLGISAARWSNFENGYPLSKEIAFKLVQIVPGLTLDWLYFGKPDGLPLELARTLGAVSGRGKARTPPR